ncbi:MULTISPECIES: HigA family addiction module antitoxin [Pseudomonas]|uniref:HigA family addiction module antitoxin n=2 Tax=Pseudomonas TaxID=286 RepID=A0A9X4D9Z5_9PSED|nr:MULTISPECIES: HigA family addiction module antitoxin [Pseudomonas]MCO6692178.1 HigA family addiction module antidote protein [Pseudomonas shirazica]MEE1900535.1 HigA family addiction module antitoxin [Pseudomonas inefficax]MDD2104979.1 HigA family addiction module antitoxin [Pseudomonas asiatica]MDD2111087.1 HigA family addiction module antitoxin [Pseudomonas asiatica]MEE1905477.1 HigA family addiction module antitoxin [Pseudomonas inefficax]
MPLYNPPHPGESLLCDVLPAIEMTVSGLAQHLDYPQVQLAAVLDGSAAISPDLAYRLERAGLGPARQYLREQAAYDLWQVTHGDHP